MDEGEQASGVRSQNRIITVERLAGNEGESGDESALPLEGRPTETLEGRDDFWNPRMSMTDDGMHPLEFLTRAPGRARMEHNCAEISYHAQDQRFVAAFEPLSGLSEGAQERLGGANQ